MRLLLDTHLLLWSAFEPERLPVAAAEMIEDDANVLIFQRRERARPASAGRISPSMPGSCAAA